MSVSSISTSEDVEFGGFQEDLAAAAFQIASWLTDPACKCHDLYRRIQVVDLTDPEGNGLIRLAKKVALFIELIGWAFLAVFTTLPAILLRFIASKLQTVPLLCVCENQRNIDGESFSLLSWNICCVGAGYSISDGGVVPWKDRIDAIIQKIGEKNADVNCLYELFDTSSAFYVCEQLKEH
ncbi:hypothetical protein L0244_24695, partial [bacterium]|nr:hypothetical protein [bacterium]